MSKRNILLFDREESPWPSFLNEFFADTQSSVLFFDQPAEAGRFISRENPDVLFIQNDILTDALAQKIRVHKQSRPEVRIFGLGHGKTKAPVLNFDHIFEEPLIFTRFQSDLVKSLDYPGKIKLLIVDDEPEITQMLVDYLRERTRPVFEVEGALNGKAGFEKILKDQPDILLMDIKMPEMNGIELYREIRRRGLNFPVIAFFDAVFGDEVLELHKIGNPAIIEKGSKESSVLDMYTALLKHVYFS